MDDNALQVVSKCAHLTYLSLQRCVAVSDRGLSALSALPWLKHLSIAGTRVLGDGLASCCQQLEVLDASGAASLRDSALRALRGSGLKTLNLEGTACTNAGLMALQQVRTAIH